MTIGIDGHDLEGNRTGVGWYLMNILKSWETQGVFSQHRVHLFLKDEIPDDLPHGVVAEKLPRVFGRFLQRGSRRRRGSPRAAEQASTALFTHLALSRAAKRHNVDVLFCPGYTAPILLPRLHRSNAPLGGPMNIGLSRIPFVLTLHDIVYEARPELFNWQSPADYVLLKWVSRRAAKRAAHILVPSTFTAQEIERHYHIPAQKITLTPLAINNAFTLLSDKTPARAVAKRYGATGPFVFFIGSMFTRRHIPDLVRAFERIAPNFPHHQLLLSGANRTRPFVDIEALIAQCNTQLGRQAVVHASYIPQEDLPMLYNAASVTVLLSDYEGFSLPPLESLACGTPVLTTRGSCMKDTVGECAHFIDDPGDVKKIAEGLRVLLSDSPHVEDLKACGLQYAARFSWDHCAKLTLEALNNSSLQR